MGVPTVASATADRIGGPPGRLRHVAPLDGVRALAVLAVAGVHTRPRLAPGGAVGVDVFFVLSGFLITSLLLDERDATGRIDVARFYARRALRLLPALALLLAAVVAWALLAASPTTRHRALAEVIAAATYTRNWTVWARTPGPLLGHTWSLALEEQFYLLWPWVLVAVLGRSGRPRRGPPGPAGHARDGRSAPRELGLLAVLLAAFVLAPVLRARDMAGWSALLLQRPEALLLGAALALARRRWGAAWQRARLSTVGVLGALALLAVAILALQAWSLHLQRPAVSIVALASAVLVGALAVAPSTPVARLLASRPMVAIGKRSYGVYLWQQPVLRWVDDRLPGRAAAVRLPIAAAVIAAAVTVSYRVVERPALALKARLRVSP